MTEETIKNLLKEIGLTEKEIEVYIFLAKHGVMKGLEITKRLKKHKAQIYSILKSLQTKGLVESTLEFPARFSAVPLETAIDLNIKAKREAAALIESTKREMLSYWKTISQSDQPTSLEKFMVIEGNSKIYPRIAQMIKETKNCLSAISTLQDLLRADQFGVFETTFEKANKSHTKCRVLTDFSSQNVKILKEMIDGIPAQLNFQGRSLDLGLRLSPRMVIRDNEEILFFISPEKENSSAENNACLWTNCKALVQSFEGVFEDLWTKSKDLKQKILETETGKSPSHRLFVFKPDSVMETFEKVLCDVKKEVVMLTFEEGLGLWKNNKILKELTQKAGVCLKVLTPFSDQNSEVYRMLSKNGEVRFITEMDFTSILVDGQHLFQFGNPKRANETITLSSFESYLYTDDMEYVEKTRIALDNLWKIASSKVGNNSGTTNNTILSEIFNSLPFGIRRRVNKDVASQYQEYEEGTITEKEIIDELITAKRMPAKNPTKDMNTLYGSYASTTIHPPSEFNLPNLRVNIWHCNKRSSWGAEDWLTIDQWLETPTGYAFVPVVHVTDNPKVTEFRKGVYANTPAAQNVVLARKDQIQVQTQGNSLFAGWTIPLGLYPSSLSLPPCCLLFEAQGELKTGQSKTVIASGKTQRHKFNRFDATVTFFHPLAKYSMSGITGVYDREHIMIAYPALKEKSDQ